MEAKPTTHLHSGSSLVVLRHLLLLLFAFLLLPNPEADAQSNLRFVSLGVADGLPHNYVVSVCQDKYGFLWVGTAGGLCRYDGYDFKLFENNNEDTLTIAGNIARSLMRDRRGAIWCSPTNGILDEYRYENESFVHHRPYPDCRITNLIEDANGLIWFVVRGQGVASYERTKRRTTLYSADTKLPHKGPASNTVNQMIVDKHNTVWLATSQGLSFRKASDAHFIHFTDSSLLHNQSFKSVHQVRINNHEVIWAKASSGPLLEFDLQGRLNKTYRLFFDNRLYEGGIEIIFQDSRGGIWLVPSDNQGLVQVSRIANDRIDGRLHQHNPDDYYSLTDNTIWDLYEDNKGVLWIATQNRLCKVDLYAKPFEHYCHLSEQGRDAAGNHVLSFCERNDRTILIGTQRGVRILKEKEIVGIQSVFENAPAELIHEPVWSICQDSSGRLWFGGKFFLIGYNPATRQFVTYRADPQKTFDWAVLWHLHPDRHQNLWIGTTAAGLYRFDLQTETFRRVQIPSEAPRSERIGNSCVFSDAQGNVWLAPLVKYNPASNTFTDYRLQNPQIESVSFKSIYETGERMLWLGSEGRGLMLFDPKSGKIVNHYTNKDGLPDKTIWGIFQDTDQNVWLSTNSGISKLLPLSPQSTPVFRNYDESDGLQGKVFNQGAWLIASDGRIFAGGSNGFNVFRPESIKDNPFTADVYITNIKLSGMALNIGDTVNKRVLLDTSTIEKRSLRLLHRENNISFEFAALHFSNPKKQVYAYKLEGFDNQWHTTYSKWRMAVYTNLSPGDYVFKVKAANPDGIWSEKTTTLQITILPPWWRTLWAFVLYTFILGALIWLARYVVVKQSLLRQAYQLERIENQKNQEIQRLKTEFFMNVSHEFRTPLTLILGPVEKLISAENLPQLLRAQALLIHRNAQRLMRLINQLLDLRRLETRQMRLNLIKGDIILSITQMFDDFKYLAQRHNIDYQLRIEVQSQEAISFDPDKLEKIMYNLISNAFKYTHDGGKITVTVKNCPAPAASKTIRIVVADTGTGIEAQHLSRIFERFFRVEQQDIRKYAGTGIGLALTKELVELHQGTISVESQVGKGSEFCVELPCTLEAESEESTLIPDTQADKYPHVSRQETQADVYVNTESEYAALLPSPPKHQPTTDIIVLIVDDNPDIRLFIASEMHQRYIVKEAANGIEGLEIALNEIPDIIICDVMMPQMDGIEFSKQIKGNPLTSHIPVVMLTARSSEEHKIAGLQSGADDYISKPFNINVLMLKIQNILHTRAQLIERFKANQNLPAARLTSNALDEAFISKITGVIESNLSDNEFDIEKLAGEFAMSRGHFHRKMKALTGLAPGEYVKTIRMRKAAELLLSSAMNITEIAYFLGFSSQPSFTRTFTAFYKKSPSQFLKDQNAQDLMQ